MTTHYNLSASQSGLDIISGLLYCWRAVSRRVYGFLYQVSKSYNGFDVDSFELVFFGNNIDWVKQASELKVNDMINIIPYRPSFILRKTKWRMI